jgi:DNA-binding Xre family transcriptional regulator/molecular chaperone GrpE (heat shock protein)
MQQAKIPSFRALSREAEVSEWQVEQLRYGKAAQMRMEVLYRLSRVLNVPLADLIATFAELPAVERAPSTIESQDSNSSTKTILSGATDPNSEANLSSDQLRQEYDRLQTQLAQQKDELQRSFQQATLQILESWLVQFPTLVYAAQQNSQFPARNFLIFMRPIEQLMKAWNIEAIAAVGAEIPYDPQLHQLMDGIAQPGEPVRVRYTGYRQGETLLYRAKVSPKIGS